MINKAQELYERLQALDLVLISLCEGTPWDHLQDLERAEFEEAVKEILEGKV